MILDNKSGLITPNAYLLSVFKMILNITKNQ